jgi:uncharacterized protein (DUF1499 family)
MKPKQLVILFVLLILVTVIGYPLTLAVVALNSPQPSNVGMGQLAPCPENASCVSSLAPTNDRYVQPLNYRDLSEFTVAQVLLQQAIQMEPRMILIVSEPGYIHAEKRTATLRFVTDVEFLLNTDAQMFEVRAISRLAQPDIEQNRQLVDRLRDRYNQLADPSATP